jgi:hypothetical protein
MTFASLEKLIRDETRRVIENLERSLSLYEEDEETSDEPATTDAPSETPAAEPAAEEKPAEEPAAEEKPAEEEPAAEEKPAEEETKDEEKPAEDDKSKEKSDSSEKPAEEEKKPNEEKTGLKTVGFLSKVDAERLDIKTDNLYPETREHLLQYDYEDIIDMYDLSIGDEKVDFSKLYKKIERISVSKHSLISKGKLDKQTIMALQHYYLNSDKINNIIRFSRPSLTNQEIETQVKLGKPKEGDSREKKYNSAMNAFTIYEMDYAFSEQMQRLDHSIVTYRSIENKDILQLFVDEGQWVDKSFLTTSLNPLICEGTGKKRMPLFEFFVPAGTSILTLPCGKNDYCHETEVTLPRNCKYTINGFNQQRNIYKILVEYNNG